ncbi:MAG: DDE-type integrase/transposase/recombinase [Deltaproteobacteria bacterium]|jgi:transposase InsO family protein|nr:DDE-type integrase/transposase/recombinase [Deltaproteobacteria bacterium]
MSSEKEREEIARRSKMVGLLYDLKDDKPAFLAERKQLAEENDVSEKTIQRYFNRYKEFGIDGLKSARKGRPGNRAIDQAVLNECIILRRENLKRSVNTLITTLEREGMIKKGSVKRSTLQDQLARAGYSKKLIRVYNDKVGASGQRFQRSSRNSLWQADTKHGPYLNRKKTYLISYVDDSSRDIMHSEFYHVEKGYTVIDCLRKAISKNGVPDDVYYDNGSPFKCHDMQRTCSLLFIQKRHTKVRSAKSKGKIEKFHQVVDSFIWENKLCNPPVTDLDVLNARWTAYYEIEYRNKKHAAHNNKMTPKEAFENDEKKLKLIDKETLDNACLFVEYGRVVDKAGCVNFRSAKYTAENLHLYIGKKVNVVWDPSYQDLVWVESDDFKKTPAKPLKMNDWVPKKASKQLPPIELPTTRSRVLDAIEKEYENNEKKRIEAFSLPKPDSSTEIVASAEDKTSEEKLTLDEPNRKGLKLQAFCGSEKKNPSKSRGGKSVSKPDGLSLRKLNKPKETSDV